MSTNRTVTIGARSAILDELSDKEVLWVIDDCVDETGYADVHAVADMLGMKHDNPVKCIGQRLSWLKRFGVVEKHKDTPGLWRLTKEGRALIGADLKAGQRRALESLTDSQVLALTTVVTDRYRKAGLTSAVMMRREWAYGTSKRRNGFH
jgi:hypothetical protein